ncbi:MAG: hypothetical protein Q8941_19940 [Bacteroidota bacterium]|nr:hypothetical protein [Bacteroidota bacterium]
MKPRQPILLLHPLFLFSLALLLLNDLYLKYEFHNWFTGKLSDFAGLFVFSVFGITLFPSYKKEGILFSALFFCWWKSPLSDPLIHFLNYRLSVPVNRMIDYTDYLALVVLPCSYRVRPHHYSVSLTRTVAVYSIGVISFLSFCSTSMIRYIQRDVALTKHLYTRLKPDEIPEKFREQNIPIQQDTAYYERLFDGFNGAYYLKIKDSSGRQQTIRIADSKEIELYRRTVPYDPAFTISYLVVKNDTIKNIRFTVSEMYNGKKRVIRLESFAFDTTLAPGHAYPGFLKRKYEKPIKKIIEKIVQ